jgi:chorismate mutase/GNAT superfamily N-acetyltransferase
VGSTDVTADVTLRRATEEDGDAIARIHTDARRAAEPAMPPGIHTAEETRDWVAGYLREGDEVWVAESGGAPVGYARLTAGWLEDLYVLPEAAGQGIGSALLDLVKAVRPSGFALWVFASNHPARGFYRRHGLVELEHTDGSGNEERAPDLRMAWPGENPLEYLRSRVDEVDDDLALLLARRAALTAAIQRVKEVPGHEGRDPAREAEIAQRMARHAPSLGEEGLRRIMHEVISVSLDAATGED